MAEYTLTPTQSAAMLDDDALGADDDAEPDADTCEHTVESTGEVCGRDLPCQYHD